LTGAVNYRNFDGVGDPLAFIFEEQNLGAGWMQLLVAVCAVIAMTSVLLVFQMGQPRIWMSMSRDGLLPPVFQKIHPKFKTPSFATIVTGLVVGIPIIFTDKTFVLDFTSIATLFAFVLVCGGVLLIPRKEKAEGKFNLPYINSRFIFPALIIGAVVILYVFAKGYFNDITEMKLNDSDKRKVVYSVISDAKGDFHENYLLSSNELKIISKKLKDDKLSDSLIDIVEHNNKLVNNLIDSTNYLYIVGGVPYQKIDQETSDTTLLISGPISIGRIYQEAAPVPISERLYPIDVNTISKVKARLKDQDSALYAKFNNQIYVYDLFDKNLQLKADSNFTNSLDKKINSITVGDIRDESATRLESKTTLNVSTIIFWIICVILAVLAFVKQWSLIPLLGLTTCLYLLTGMTKANWLWFGSWLLIGLIIYFIYGYKKSRLAVRQ
jgi:amino acid transporter